MRLNKLERSNRTPNHLFVRKFIRNIETIRTYLKIKICTSYRHRVEYEGDNIDSLGLNKLERSNRTTNHLFVCKFKRNIQTQDLSEL